MSTIPAEQYKTLHSQNIALQRLASSKEDAILLSHLLQAALVVERGNPVRQAVMAHWDLVRNVVVMIVVMLSVTLGWLAPQIARALWAY